MSVICPTVTATSLEEYNIQVNRLLPFAKRLHIDIMDGDFAPSKSPDLRSIWWPHAIKADIHLMYRRPMDYIEQLIKLRPRMVIIHNEADVHHMHFAGELHKEGILTGLAILQETPIENTYQIMHSYDQVLIFSGHLGYHGGQADLHLLEKVKSVRQRHPEAEIAWDGGINQDNIGQLADSGVDVFNVGSYIHDSTDPGNAYATLEAVIKG